MFILTLFWEKTDSNWLQLGEGSLVDKPNIFHDSSICLQRIWSWVVHVAATAELSAKIWPSTTLSMCLHQIQITGHSNWSNRCLKVLGWMGPRGRMWELLLTMMCWYRHADMCMVKSNRQSLFLLAAVASPLNRHTLVSTKDYQFGQNFPPFKVFISVPWQQINDNNYCNLLRVDFADMGHSSCLVTCCLAFRFTLSALTQSLQDRVPSGQDFEGYVSQLFAILKCSLQGSHCKFLELRPTRSLRQCYSNIGNLSFRCWHCLFRGSCIKSPKLCNSGWDPIPLSHLWDWVDKSCRIWHPGIHECFHNNP